MVNISKPDYKTSEGRRAYARAYRAKNRERCLARQRVYNKTHYAKFKQKRDESYQRQFNKVPEGFRRIIVYVVSPKSSVSNKVLLCPTVEDKKRIVLVKRLVPMPLIQI